MSYELIRGDATSLPLADDSVDLICTSPPYFAMRSYTDGGEHYDGQIGSEATPQEFLEALWAWTTECRRVLKPSGSMWVNLGDKMSRGDRTTVDGTTDKRRQGDSRVPPCRDIPAKSLMGLPWRYAIGCIDQLGLILRAEVIWSKPNGLPESVTDRVRRSHEQWFHFTKEPRYFSAVDEIRESPANPPRRTLSAPSSRPTLGPELAATFRTDHGPTVARGWCQLGSLQQPVSLAMAGQAERFEVVDLVGFFLRVEGPERDYVVDLKPTGGPALDAPMAVAVESALADLAPSNPSPGVVAARPSGVLCSGAVVGDALGRAEVLGLEITPVSAEGIAARITLDLKPGRATLLVWDAFAGCHDDILPPKSSRSADTGYRDDRDHGALNPLGKLPGSVWTVPTEPLRVPDHIGVDHFAAFPSEFPRRIILGWSPSGVCVACGEGRRPVVATGAAFPRDEIAAGRNGKQTKERGDAATVNNVNGQEYNAWRAANPHIITGYACACPDTTAPTRPAVVLDPFCGTGTTPAVAHVLGRHGIGIDLSADYLRLAEWRCNDPVLRAKVLRVEKPKAVPEGQLDMFGGEAA